MKKGSILAIATLLVLSTALSSCLGSLALTNKVRVWNKQISNKFINELVYIGLWIVPVYETCFISDILVLNSIEFWSGKNPVATTSEKIVHSEHGDLSIVSNQTGYRITNLSDSSVCELLHDEAEDSWVMKQNGKSTKLFNYVDGKHVQMPNGMGGNVTVTLDENGVMAYEQLASGLNLAFRR